MAIALKGYALLLMPAYCIFMLRRSSLRETIAVGAYAVPMILQLLATFGFSGWEGVSAPFKIHAQRLLNGGSSYDVVNYRIRFGYDFERP